jgi:hypothetical protein
MNEVQLTMQKRNLLATLATLLLSTTMMFSQGVGSGNPHGQGSLAVPITGTLTNSGALSSAPTGASALTGTFNINSFAVQNNASGTPQLVALGNLVGTVTNAAGQATTLVLNNVAAPVAATGSCSILTLTLGPLDLNLLGLEVQIPNAINLNIVAQSGPGNLLGNLLCSVSNLLNGGGPLGQVATALNRILGALGL